MANPQITTFSAASAKRIADAVRDFESESADAPAGATPRDPRRRRIIGKIESAAAGGGYYKGRRVFRTAPAAINVSAGFTESVLGTVGGAEIYLANLIELGKSTHDLTASANTKTRYFEIEPFGVATDGKPVFIILGLWMKDCG